MVETLNEEYVGRVFLDEKEFPDDLEGRMSSVLNAVNTELKTVTLLHLDDRPADSIEIRDRIRDTRGEGYLPLLGNFGRYGNTLHDIALVAKQTVVRDNGETQVLGYSLTEAGRKYGVPIAEHVLKWVVDNDLSMYNVLGSTTSKGKTRSPENRVGILEALSTGEASEKELADFLDLLPHVALGSLIGLDKIGFVEFDSIGAKPKRFSKYVWIDGKNPEDVETIRGYATLTKKIAQEMSKGQELENNSLSKIVGYKYFSNVSSVLTGLEEQGFLRRTTPYQTKVSLSKAKILEPGQRFLEEVILPVQKHLVDEAVLETDFGERDSEYVAKGIDIYRRVSPYINKVSPSERIQQIKNYLLRNSGATSKEISGAIGLGVSGVLGYMGKMDGLRTEKEGHEVRYFLDNGSGGEE